MSKKRSIANMFEHLSGENDTTEKTSKIEEEESPKVVKGTPKKELDKSNSTEEKKKTSNKDSNKSTPKEKDIEEKGTDREEEGVVGDVEVEEQDETIDNIENNEVQNISEEESTLIFQKILEHKYAPNKRKKTIEDTHTRQTFLLRNDLVERLNNLTKDHHGMKHNVLNDAVEAIVMALENSQDK